MSDGLSTEARLAVRLQAAEGLVRDLGSQLARERLEHEAFRTEAILHWLPPVIIQEITRLLEPATSERLELAVKRIVEERDGYLETIYGSATFPGLRQLKRQAEDALATAETLILGWKAATGVATPEQLLDATPKAAHYPSDDELAAIASMCMRPGDDLPHARVMAALRAVARMVWVQAQRAMVPASAPPMLPVPAPARIGRKHPRAG